MMVVDYERSEHGPQRRKNASGRLLHCCCICGHLGPWTREWSWYGSIKDIDDEAPFPKFCSPACASAAGKHAEKVTEGMRRGAKEAEWRPPELAYRAATERQKYNAAASDQRHRRAQSDRYPEGRDAISAAPGAPASARVEPGPRVSEDAPKGDGR